MDLSEKTIVITGASRGLGRELALRLSRGRPRLVLVGRDRITLQDTGAEIVKNSGRPPLVFTCEVSREDRVEALAKQVRCACPRVDVLVNNAGIGHFAPAVAHSTEELRRQMEVNFYGAVYCIGAFLPLLSLSRAGYILNVGSLLSEVSLPATGAYAASKCALHGYTLALQRDLQGSRLRAGIVLPGPMRTAFHAGSEAAPSCPDFLLRQPGKVAALMEQMIRKRAQRAYAYRSTLWLMRLKAACSLASLRGRPMAGLARKQLTSTSTPVEERQ